ncbi:uncharacterized protein N7469_008563 [Penicillium citrinum]|uniref:Uncharacterized protein n=1 Tax=Penicillium citrinum TaxID=5077 RepID=A0A9W9NP83_PENCI|nr:uncharacterized protein N7469_008563 [Penicillium citrinum]KAJ5222323.1 hypothetical protein N7469_008563 [Penicillium citrinum]
MSSGCYYYPPGSRLDYTLPTYLPQVEMDVHATILSTSSRTVITKAFVNPSSTDPIPEFFYTFPLYENSSIAEFTSTIDERTVKGVVKPKWKAEEVYKEVKAKGKAAAIFDQSIDSPDVFKIRIGNLPADEEVHIELILVAELKQDTQTNGPRYKFPLSIAPRYGAASHDIGFQTQPPQTSLRVDISMEKGSNIREIRSPGHPITVTLGRTSSMDEMAFEPRYASVTLRENVLSNGNFILTINATNQDRPCSFLETHPTLPDQQALMVSLVPKFTIQSEDPEIIFVIDRSGSMEDKIPTLRSALNLFLKSIPIGVHFNIVSFGTRISYLWKRSRACNRTSLGQAIRHSKRFEADHRGTEILAAREAAVDSRRRNKLLDVLLLTDGQIWNQEECMELVRESHKTLSTRFFTLGIGDEVSHSLIEGISRAGAGFSQTVLNYEERDERVIYMLKGALMGRLSNITLDMNLPEMMDEEFTEIEGSRSSTVTPRLPATISLFDENCTGSKPIEELHPLPKVPAPDFIQSPNELPPLYPFVRTTAYVLLSKHIDTFPEKITLRASSSSGPLELEIPVQDVGVGETVHKLAAKKTTTELEEGAGWIYTAKDVNGDLISVKCPARVEELV